ncbi:hypothetical protein [Microbacterium sp. GXF6406]
MSTETQRLLRAVLISQQRYELALERFPNLLVLADVAQTAQLVGFDEYPHAVQHALRAPL